VSRATPRHPAQRELQARLAIDQRRVLELDGPFQIGDEIVAADRAIDAGGG